MKKVLLYLSIVSANYPPTIRLPHFKFSPRQRLLDSTPLWDVPAYDVPQIKISTRITRCSAIFRASDLLTKSYEYLQTWKI